METRGRMFGDVGRGDAWGREVGPRGRDIGEVETGYQGGGR